MNTETRKHWSRALVMLPEKRLHAVANKVVNGWKIVHKKIPKEGLGLLRINDGALGEDFYLGEFPLAAAHIELHNEQGDAYEGGAVVMSDSSSYAVSLAVCDAVYANQLPGWEKVALLVEEGVMHQREKQNVRNGMLSKTKVDFSLLETTDESGE